MMWLSRGNRVRLLISKNLALDLVLTADTFCPHTTPLLMLLQLIFAQFFFKKNHMTELLSLSINIIYLRT